MGRHLDLAVMSNTREPLTRDPIAEARRNWERQGWDEVAEPMAAVTSIMRAQQILLARAHKALKPFSLTFARFELLALLDFSRERRMPMSKAGALLQVHPTSVTNAVDRLESAGLVAREPHPGDRRATLLSLTEKGREVTAKAAAALNEQVFADTGLSDEDVTGLIQILTRFRRSAGDFEDGEGA